MVGFAGRNLSCLCKWVLHRGVKRGWHRQRQPKFGALRECRRCLCNTSLALSRLAGLRMRATFGRGLETTVRVGEGWFPSGTGSQVVARTGCVPVRCGRRSSSILAFETKAKLHFFF